MGYKMSKPLRVMQVVGRMMGGGVEAAVMNYYRCIDKNRIQFDFVVQSDSLAVPKKEIESLGGRIFFVPSYNNPIAYMSACSQIFENTHPFIVHSHMNAVSVFVLRAAKHMGVPVRIAHSHSTSNPKEFRKTAVKKILRPLSRIYPTDLAACSNYAARWLFGDKAVDRRQVRIIKNSIDLRVFHYDSAARQSLRKNIGANESTVVVGQVGRLCFQKNQQLTLRAFLNFCPQSQIHCWFSLVQAMMKTNCVNWPMSCTFLNLCVFLECAIMYLHGTQRLTYLHSHRNMRDWEWRLLKRKQNLFQLSLLTKLQVKRSSRKNFVT